MDLNLSLDHSMLHQKVENAFSTELRWNSGMTFLFLLSGDLHLQVGSKTYHLRPNDFLFFPPYEVFCAPAAGERYQAYVITMGQKLLSQICPELERMRFDIQLIRANDELPVYNAICTTLAQIFYHSIKKEPCASARVVAHGCDLLTTVVTSFGEEYGSDTVPPAASQSHQRVIAILRYINQHYPERITLEDIAESVGFHPQYFSTYFKKQFGSNFSEYLSSYRVNQSLHALVNSDQNILDIAIANGFNNHKTYSAAFRRVFGLSPREYRLKAQQTAPAAEVELPLENDFRFLQQFWSPDATARGSVGTVRSHNTIYFRPNPKLAFENGTKNYISVGRAFACLRSDVQEQLRQARHDLQLDYVRIRDIFSDDLFVYYEDENKNPIFSWKALDQVFDFLLSIGAKPYPEIGYMPSQLASKKQYAGWQYHPNVSFPKSLSRWQLLITRFFEHILHRYGPQEVETWRFDFWTSPNLQIIDGYWNESQEKFFQFYEATDRAMHRVNPNLKLATPNFSYPSGMNWYRDFFLFAKRRKLSPAFLSIQLYSCTDGQPQSSSSFLRYDLYGSSSAVTPVTPERDLMVRAVRELRQLQESCGFPQLPIVVSDWNVSFMPIDYTRDTCFMGPFVLKSYIDLIPFVEGMSFASLSDIHEDFFNTDLLFHGGPGLMDYHGIPKASYYALSMAYRLSKHIMQTGENYIIAKSETGYEMLLFNLDFYDANYRTPDTSIVTYSQRYAVFEAVHALNCHIIFAVEPSTYTITKHRVNRESGSSYDIWLKMGAPTELSADLARHLRSRCVPDVYCETITSPTNELHFDELVPPHGLVYIRVERRE